MLMNWRGKPFSYTYASFSDVFNDLSREHKQRPQNEFTNKIVIIGSTAPSLFDIKATPMDRQFPGVEILATAIDNVKHRDYLKVWRGQIPYILLSLLLIWGTTFAFYFKVDREKFNSIFTGSQIGLLVLSYLAINFTYTYLDLSAPILWAVALFGIAKIYSMATERALQRWLAFGTQHKTGTSSVLVMPILIESDEALSDALLKSMKREIELGAKMQPAVEILAGTQSGIWGLFGDMLVASWEFNEQEAAQASQVMADADNVGDQLPRFIKNTGLPTSTVARYSTHEAKLNYASNTLAAQWRTIFAQAVIKLEHETE